MSKVRAAMGLCNTANMASDDCLEYMHLMQEDNENRLTRPLQPIAVLSTTIALCKSAENFHRGKAKQCRYGQSTCISAADCASGVLNNALRQALVNPCQPLLSVCLVSLAPLFHGHHSCSLSPQPQLLSDPGYPLLKDVAPQLAGTEPAHLCLQSALAQLLNCIVNRMPYILIERVTNCSR